MPLAARALIRKMRGGAQAHLVEAEDGGFYVVKSTNNPQHRRILVNEWLANSFLRQLQIHVPETAVVEFTPDFIARTPDLYLAIGPDRVPIPAGPHFGSRMAVHPDRVAVFDYLPDKLLEKIENRAEFLGALVFDKWVSNMDSRQAVFFRARAKSRTPVRGETPSRVGFFAQMIDHGFAFNGPHWSFVDSAVQGLYFRHSVYAGVRSLDSFQPWLDMVQSFPVEVIDAAWREIPRAWLEDDEADLERMLDALLTRRKRVPDLLAQIPREKPAVFPLWQKS